MIDDDRSALEFSLSWTRSRWRSGCALSLPTSVSASSSSLSAGLPNIPYTQDWISLRACLERKSFFRFSPYEWQIEESMSGTTVLLTFELNLTEKTCVLGEQPLQRDQQPLVCPGSVHAAGDRHNTSVNLRQDSRWGIPSEMSAEKQTTAVSAGLGRIAKYM